MLHGYERVEVNGVEVWRRTLVATARKVFGVRQTAAVEIITVQLETAS